jgi:FXSXX-COOH protein
MREPEEWNESLGAEAMVDLVDIPLAEIRTSGDSALAHALRRLMEDVSDPDDVIAGFQSAL